MDHKDQYRHPDGKWKQTKRSGFQLFALRHKGEVAKGPVTYPPDHQPGMTHVGGFSCAQCRFLSADGKHCSSEYFQKWNKSDVLPAPASDYCSDWFVPK